MSLAEVLEDLCEADELMDRVLELYGLVFEAVEGPGILAPTPGAPPSSSAAWSPLSDLADDLVS